MLAAPENRPRNAKQSEQLLPRSVDAFRYVHSDNVPEILNTLHTSIAVSTYQAGKLLVVRASQGRLSMLARSFDKVMGLAIAGDRMAVATTSQVWRLRNSPLTAAKLQPENTHDACFLPRSSHVTGNIDAHEIGWAGDELWIVNTLFSCLCTLDEDYSFVPRWRPPFVTELARQDRCHLNGMAIVNGRPRFVTAFSETNEPEGWREHKLNGGVVIDVASGETIARGLSMPHSPRVHGDRLFVLDSGRGRLCEIDQSDGHLETIVELPGYTRGLAFYDRFAFVGLSQIRETAVFGGVPIAERPAERVCGVSIIDLETGREVGFVRFEGEVTEVFDVQLLPGMRFPAVVGFQNDTIQRACVIGPEKGIN